MARVLGITKRIDLSTLAEGWDGCYILVKPLTYDLLKEVREVETDNLTEEVAVDKMISLIKRGTVGGQVMLTDERGALTADTLQADDIDHMSVEMVVHIFGDMTGQGAQYGDPKASPTPTRNDG